jgi:eukaryotic-like serine/threonine-protein kinase
MPLAPGTRLGPYEIGASLGAGGMGEVYRARDTKLKRDVAVKVLPEIFATDNARKLRFEREAELLASLNHPNIAHIYGVEDSGAVRALVMELVDGTTLAERIARGPITLEEAVLLAKQIADGLEYAHERGIIHRDLKPANIKVAPDGQVKILDFGLAKALVGDSAEWDIATSPTISVAATSAGVLLGTAGYMSPEQAKGKPVDRRADIWAFGCVLSEMLTGKPTFDGETITDKLAAVVRAEPELAQLPEQTPQRLRELLQRCLIKDPKQRLQAIGEARIALENSLKDRGEHKGASVAVASRRREWMLMVFGAAGVLAAVVFASLYWNRLAEKPRVVRSHLKPMPGSSLMIAGSQSGFALSPDGTRVAYMAQNADGKAVMWIRPIDSFQAQALPGTEGATNPFWSPDSQSVGFFVGGKLKKIQASGGPPLTICDAPHPRGGTWNQEDVILLAPVANGPIYRVSASGGTATPLTSLDSSKGETTHRWPQFLSDGRHFLYVAGTPFGFKSETKNAIVIGSLDSKESKILMQTHSGAIYSSGHILFLRESTLMAQAFDVKRLELIGNPIPVADPVLEDEATLQLLVSASQNGLLGYMEGTSNTARELLVVDRGGKNVGGMPGPDAYLGPRWSPDGKKLLYTLEAAGYDIWSYDIARQVKTRLTFASGSSQANFAAIWSPDGKRIAYASSRGGKFGLYEKPIDGAGNEKPLGEAKSQAVYPNDWSPNGKFLAYQRSGLGITETWILPVAREGIPFAFQQSPFNILLSAFSPDGKWIAYCSNESGETKVYVMPFPGPGGKWQVSPGGGWAPRWRRDGKEIFYLSSDNKMMSAEVKANGSNFEIGAVKPLFETRPNRTYGGYDVSADGQRFVIAFETGQPNTAITLVVNWDAELMKK